MTFREWMGSPTERRSSTNDGYIRAPAERYKGRLGRRESRDPISTGNRRDAPLAGRRMALSLALKGTDVGCQEPIRSPASPLRRQWSFRQTESLARTNWFGRPRLDR